MAVLETYAFALLMEIPILITQGTPYAIYTQNARTERQIRLDLFAHGLTIQRMGSGSLYWTTAARKKKRPMKVMIIRQQTETLILTFVRSVGVAPAEFGVADAAEFCGVGEEDDGTSIEVRTSFLGLRCDMIASNIKSERSETP